MEWYHWVMGAFGTASTALVTIMLPGWLKFRQGMMEHRKQESVNAIQEVREVVALQAQEFEKALQRQDVRIRESASELEIYKHDLAATRKELREIHESYNSSLREIARRDVEIIELKAEIATLTRRLNVMDTKNGD